MAASKPKSKPATSTRPAAVAPPAGPLGPYVGGFVNLLGRCRYSRLAIGKKTGLVFGLSRWMDRSHLKIAQLDEQQAARFLKARWRCGPRRSGDQATAAQLLRHLRQLGVVPPAQTTTLGPADATQHEYERFLLQQRGLMPASACQYLTVARRFLRHVCGAGPFNPEKLRARDVTDFVLHDTSTRGRRSAQLMTVALRSFLDFLLQQGHMSANLANAVPAVAGWRLSELPRYLEGGQVERLLRSCDRGTKVGKRDYAILLLLARLGLRAGEVVGLSLEDIDWLAGHVLVRGKGARVDRLPLVRDVGQAIADYLQNGRPRCSCRRLFVQCKAPYEGFPGSATISSMVGRALQRSQLDPPNHGAHLLRHSLATGMLRNGASLSQIAQVLRHQQTATTEIYAKVDLGALRGLAQPWPGGTQ